MKAIILAAGQGTRLKKYTQNLPKGMLSFMGKTLIEWQIGLFHSCGINDVHIVTGFAADKIKYGGVKYCHNPKFAETNMVESFMCAKEAFTDDAIVSYSDILFEKQMLRKIMESEADFSCAVDDDWKAYWKKRYGRVDFDTESLEIDKKDHIIELGLENPPMENICARYIGLLKFSRNGLDFIVRMMEKAYMDFEDKPWQQSGKTIRKAYMTDLLNALIKSGKDVTAVHFNNGWIEFDTNEDYENAVRWAREGSLAKILHV